MAPSTARFFFFFNIAYKLSRAYWGQDLDGRHAGKSEIMQELIKVVCVKGLSTQIMLTNEISTLLSLLFFQDTSPTPLLTPSCLHTNWFPFSVYLQRIQCIADSDSFVSQSFKYFLKGGKAKRNFSYFFCTTLQLCT